MPEHLKALIVILAAAVAVFWFAERALCPAVVERADFRRRRNVWFAITLIAFLSHNYWLYALLTACVAYRAGRRDPNPLALYFTVLFAVPWWLVQIPGLGLVNYFFSLTHFKLLNLAILLPLALQLVKPGVRPRTLKVADSLMLAYMLYMLAMTLPMLNVTGVMRGVFDTTVEVWIPYFVASRALRGIKVWREVVAGLTMAVSVMALLAPFESLRSWLLYDGLRNALDIGAPGLGTYLLRSDDGPLRSMASQEHAIVLGYVIMIAAVLYYYLGTLITSRVLRYVGVVVLLVGLFATFSRGPWMGAVFAIVAALIAGPNASRNLVAACVVAAVAAGAALVVPGGERVIAHLPFARDGVTDGSVAYRTQLFEVSMSVFWNAPVFGSLAYLGNAAMEEMRQGQGIIDMVNTYLAVALPFGAVGLLLFCLPFLYALWVCRGVLARKSSMSPEVRRLGAALVGVVVGIMVTIATVSSIGSVPAMYWLLIGLCAGFGTMVTSTVDSGARRAALRPFHGTGAETGMNR
jgi:O-Antigen ligase